MKFDFKKLLPHLIVTILLCVISLAYYAPALRGHKITQPDIIEYIGMSKQQEDYRKAYGEDPYWSDSSFVGLPTYQMGAQYPNYYIKKLDKLIRFLPRPADYLFLSMICFYVLMLVMGVKPRVGFLGALAYGLSSYFTIIIGAGHNSKMHAIAYFPLVLAGILMVFQRKYIGGFILATLALALQMVANHFQMTYYLLLMVIILGVVYFIDAFRTKELPHFFKSVGILSIAAVLSILLNATSLMATQEYVKESTRSKSELTIDPTGKPKRAEQGLTRSYIVQYSYGISESMNVFIPRINGGSTTNEVEFDRLGPRNSEFIKAIRPYDSELQYQMMRYGRIYWGGQPFIAGPAYIGAVIIFLFVLGLFFVSKRFKAWVLATIVIMLMLSWGDNFDALTDFFIEHFPLYNKFRAVSSIQVIIELVVPILAIVGLSRFFSKIEEEDYKQKAIFITTGILGGICLIFYLFGSSMFDFISPTDSIFEKFPNVTRALRADRISVFKTDCLRALGWVILTAGILWGYLKLKMEEKTKNWLVIIAIAGIVMIDLISFNKNYVNDSNFVSKREFNNIFETEKRVYPSDYEVMQDKSDYRVYDANQMMTGKPSYYHKAIGGYFAAKPRRFQELYDFYISDEEKKNEQNKQYGHKILDILNVKYEFVMDERGRMVAEMRPTANGSAWFVETLNKVASPNEEILSFKTLDVKNEAVTSDDNKLRNSYAKDSLSSIQLTQKLPNHLIYETSNSGDGLAIFSEMHYPHGWTATIDGVEVPIHRANYILRALEVPAGKHTIEFKFDPQVVKTGSTITLISSLLFFFIMLGAGYITLKKKKVEISE